MLTGSKKGFVDGSGHQSGLRHAFLKPVVAAFDVRSEHIISCIFKCIHTHIYVF